MRKTVLIPLAALAVLGASLAQAQERGWLRERIAARMAQRGQNDAPRLRADQTIAYGSEALQQLDFYRAKGAGTPAPLVVYVHGGGWKRGSKETAASRYAPAHFTQLGYNYASIDYRLVPDASVEQQGADVAAALKALLDRAGALGIDPGRVVLLGHSAGAHLVALVGTDEQYLRGAGLSFANLKGVIPNDGAAYDVPRQIADGGNFMHDTYLQAFGADPARQRALSPTLQAAAPNAPAFLLIHVQRADGIAQAKELEAALKAAGTRVERKDFPGKGLRGHMEINRDLGKPDYPATAVVDAWLKGVFGG